MSDIKNSTPIPIIDIFAGPGGLGEGFSTKKRKNSRRGFDIKLSIEKDEIAHQTLLLRSFFRKFEKETLPPLYYEVLKEKDIKEREKLILQLYKENSKKYHEAQEEAWCAELGEEKFPSSVVDKRISTALNGARDWVLIGGPPCQAFSLVGRSRVGGIREKDERVYLYKEYLRIIAKHHPAVFVMENVKGLLSAKLNGEKVFDWMKRDLQNPSSVFKELKSPRYKIFSLSQKPDRFGSDGFPEYSSDRDFLIKAEKYGIPQNRHRVILLGIREDLSEKPQILKEKNEVTLKDVIGDLPELRSGISKSIVSSETVGGKKRRVYKKEKNDDITWENFVNSFQKEICSINGFSKIKLDGEIKAPPNGIGGEFIEYDFPDKGNPLKEWYYDENLPGIANHESRSHLTEDLKRYMFSSLFSHSEKRFPRLHEFENHGQELMPDHSNAKSGKFNDRFRVQLPDRPATTVTSHISKDGHYFIHYDPKQCRSLTVREAARIQTFPDNYLFCGSRTAQYHQVGNAVPPYLAKQIAEIVEEILE